MLKAGGGGRGGGWDRPGGESDGLMTDNSQEEEEDKEDKEDKDTGTSAGTITAIRTAISEGAGRGRGGGTGEAGTETQLVKLQRMFVKSYLRKHTACQCGRGTQHT